MPEAVVPKPWEKDTHLKFSRCQVLLWMLWISLQFLGDLCWHGCSIHGTWPNHSSKNVYDLPGTGQLPLQWWWVKFSSPLTLSNCWGFCQLKLSRCVFPHINRKNSSAGIAPSSLWNILLGRACFIQAVILSPQNGQHPEIPHTSFSYTIYVNKEAYRLWATHNGFCTANCGVQPREAILPGAHCGHFSSAEVSHPVLPIAKQRRHVDPQLHPSNKTHFSSDRHSWTQRNWAVNSSVPFRNCSCWTLHALQSPSFMPKPPTAAVPQLWKLGRAFKV